MSILDHVKALNKQQCQHCGDIAGHHLGCPVRFDRIRADTRAVQKLPQVDIAPPPAPGPLPREVTGGVGKVLREAEYTGGSVSYYQVRVTRTTSGGDAYTAECNDLIEALGMNYAEGNAFKAIWRLCAARTLGKTKRGYTDSLYDAEKVVFFGQRMVVANQEKPCPNDSAASAAAPATANQRVRGGG
jgi:hypothetical protein